jgi:hypothetical protein
MDFLANINLWFGSEINPVAGFLAFLVKTGRMLRARKTVSSETKTVAKGRSSRQAK